MAVDVLHTTDRAIASQTVRVTLGGTYNAITHPEATDAITAARTDALASLGPGRWALKFDIAQDAKDATWVVVVEATLAP